MSKTTTATASFVTGQPVTAAKVTKKSVTHKGTIGAIKATKKGAFYEVIPKDGAAPFFTRAACIKAA